MCSTLCTSPPPPPATSRLAARVRPRVSTRRLGRRVGRLARYGADGCKADTARWIRRAVHSGYCTLDSTRCSIGRTQGIRGAQDPQSEAWDRSAPPYGCRRKIEERGGAHGAAQVARPMPVAAGGRPKWLPSARPASGCQKWNRWSAIAKLAATADRAWCTSTDVPQRILLARTPSMDLAYAYSYTIYGIRARLLASIRLLSSLC